MRSLSTPAALLGALAVTALVACDEPAPTRVWRPEDHAHPAGAPPSRMAAPAPEEAPAGTARERALAALYGVHCASCHGPAGRGDGPRRAPAMQLPDFASVEWQRSRDDEALAGAIAHGRNMMPGFGDRIAEENIAGLVQVVRGFAAPEEAPAVAAPDGAPAP